jgi:urease accessory protein UreE
MGAEMPDYRVTHLVEVGVLVTARNKAEAAEIAFSIGESHPAQVESVDLLSVERLRPEPTDP